MLNCRFSPHWSQKEQRHNLETEGFSKMLSMTIIKAGLVDDNGNISSPFLSHLCTCFFFAFNSPSFFFFVCFLSDLGFWQGWLRWHVFGDITPWSPTKVSRHVPGAYCLCYQCLRISQASLFPLNSGFLREFLFFPEDGDSMFLQNFS
jgi:hypothetical protein